MRLFNHYVKYGDYNMKQEQAPTSYQAPIFKAGIKKWLK